MIHKETDGLKHLTSLRDGTFKQGLGIDCDLDNHLRYKKTDLTVLAGHANVGKTLSIIFYFVALAKKHGLKFAVLSSENEIGSLKDDIICMYTCKKIADLSTADFEYAHYWLNEHFKFIEFEGFFTENKRLINHRDVLKIVDDLPDTHSFNPNSFVIDPYNSLGRDEDIKGNKHIYDYTVLAELRIYCKENKKACYILAHGVTEALRKTHNKGHDFEGYTIPMLAADIEGGGKYVNRADNFICIHRYVDHKTEWNKTEWHIRKIKNTKTGGRPTFKDNPVILRALQNLLGFEVYIKEENFAEPKAVINPITEEKQEQREAKPLPINTDFDKSVQIAKERLQDEEIEKANKELGIEYKPVKFTK